VNTDGGDFMLLVAADLSVRLGRDRGPSPYPARLGRRCKNELDDQRCSPILSAVPFSLRIDVLDRMLNLEISDDPVYQGLEIQAFDDPDHGRGMTVFLSR